MRDAPGRRPPSLVTLRFWAGRNAAVTLTFRADPNEVDAKADGIWVRGEITHGDDVFALGRAHFFVPLRQLLWLVEREEAASNDPGPIPTEPQIREPQPRPTP